MKISTYMAFLTAWSKQVGYLPVLISTFSNQVGDQYFTYPGTLREMWKAWIRGYSSRVIVAVGRLFVASPQGRRVALLVLAVK